MELVYDVWFELTSLLLRLWNTSVSSWGIFGTWLISFAILRKIAKTFNKLKS